MQGPARADGVCRSEDGLELHGRRSGDFEGCGDVMFDWFARRGFCMARNATTPREQT